MSSNAPEDITARRERVLALTRRGQSARTIANTLGTTRRTINRDRHALGITKEPPKATTPEQWARADVLIADGCSISEVARTIGVSWGVVKDRYPDAGWSAREGAQWAAFCHHFQAKELT